MVRLSSVTLLQEVCFVLIEARTRIIARNACAPTGLFMLAGFPSEVWAF